MKKCLQFSFSITFIVLLLFAYQNCGKNYSSGATVQQSTDEVLNDDDALLPSDQVPQATANTAPVVCPSQSPLKNQIQNLGSVVDRAAILESFPATAAQLPSCTLQPLPDTRFTPPLRTASTFRAYMDRWVDHSIYIMRAADGHLRAAANTTGKADLANCVLNHLNELARRNIFAEPRDSYADNQGEYERSWLLVSFNVAFDKIRREPNLSANQLSTVQQWLGRSGSIVMDKFNLHIAGRPQNSNSNLYWAGVALMVSGINTSNMILYNRGVQFIRIGLDQIQPNGTLPLEMNKGVEAFRHHIVALQPLMFAAQIAKLNNLDLFSYGNNALHRLTQLMINSFKDFSQFSQLTSSTQTYLPSHFLSMYKWDLAWMEIYFSQTGNVDLIPYLNTLRPLGSGRIGNATHNYGLLCL